MLQDSNKLPETGGGFAGTSGRASSGLPAASGRSECAWMLHLAKLAVGISGIGHLRAVQARRAAAERSLCHRTRHFPRRSAEVLAGGSMYWVIGGAMVVRQRILGIERDRSADGSACAALVLDPELVPVLGRPAKPFQGWRYLSPEQAPPDLTSAAPVAGEAELPITLRRELRSLALL